MVGVFDKSTNELTLRRAPLYVVRHQVKTLKSLEPIVESKHDYQHARNVLGEAFGTKKAKAAIRAAEKNKVDVAAMKDVCTSAGPLFPHLDHLFRSQTLSRAPSNQIRLCFRKQRKLKRKQIATDPYLHSMREQAARPRLAPTSFVAVRY